MVSIDASPSDPLARAQRARSASPRAGSSARSCRASRTLTRSSAAAASVKVMATSWDISTRPWATSSAIRPTMAVVLPVPAPASTKRVLSKSVSSVRRASWSAARSSGRTAELLVDERAGPVSLALPHLVPARRADPVEGAVEAVLPAGAVRPAVVGARHLGERARPQTAIHHVEDVAEPFLVVRHLQEAEVAPGADEPVAAVHANARVPAANRGGVDRRLDPRATHQRVVGEVALLVRPPRLVVDEASLFRSSRIGPEVDAVDPSTQPCATTAAQVHRQLFP